MHKLLTRQVRSLEPSGAPDALDTAELLRIVDRTYEEFDRERRLNYRAAQLTEEELKDANARARERHATILSAVLSNVPQAVLVLNTGGVVVSANAAADHIFGAKSSVEGRNVSEFVTDTAGNPVPLVPTHFQEKSGRAQDGTTFPLEYSLALFDAEEGQRLLMIARDISERKQREAELTAAKEAAESANQLKSEFLAMMSHELRTPLNAILGFSEIIRDQGLGENEGALRRYREYAGHAHDSGKHLLSLISDILDLSRIEAGNYQLDLMPVNLGGVVRDCMAIIHPLAVRNAIAVVGIDDLPPITIEGDNRAVKQVLLNLLSNAVKFTGSGGQVSVTAAHKGDAVEIAVADTGIGIPPEKLEVVFEPFRQLDSGNSRRYEGSGLGLTISRRLMELHGGEIRLESKVGEGTRAMVRFPARLTSFGAASAA